MHHMQQEPQVLTAKTSGGGKHEAVRRAAANQFSYLTKCKWSDLELRKRQKRKSIVSEADATQLLDVQKLKVHFTPAVMEAKKGCNHLQTWLKFNYSCRMKYLKLCIEFLSLRVKEGHWMLHGMFPHSNRKSKGFQGASPFLGSCDWHEEMKQLLIHPTSPAEVYPTVIQKAQTVYIPSLPSVIFYIVTLHWHVIMCKYWCAM